MVGPVHVTGEVFGRETTAAPDSTTVAHMAEKVGFEPTDRVTTINA